MRRPVLFAILMILWGGFWMPLDARDLSWTNDEAMLIFFEAVTQIKKHALKGHGTGQIAADAVKAYMHQHDPYGDYLTSREYTQWKQAQQFHFFGVGMELMVKDGSVFCMPRPGSPAREQGVHSGDRLTG